MKNINLSKINQIALSLFGAVLSQQMPVERNVKKEEKLFVDYNVVLLPSAQYAVDEIFTHIQKNKKTAKQLNATFYRSWSDVLSKTRFELLIDQIIHYATTYGTNFEGEMYVPANYSDLELSKEEAKLPVSFISCLTEDELAGKAIKLLSSGVALKQETVEEVLELLDLMSKLVQLAHKITNKEAKIVAAEKYGLISVFNQSDLIRYLVFKATGSTLLIKNPKTVEEIIASKLDVSETLNAYGISLVAESFNRYKPLYLAFKKANHNNAQVINKISKLSKVLHKPMFENPLSMITANIFTKEDLKFLESSSVPTLIRGYNAALLGSEYSSYSTYVIRNGKMWVSEEKNVVNKESMRVAKINGDILKDIIVEKLGKNFEGKKVFIPKEIEYGLPLSEKQMCGNIPNNTIISTEGTLCVGAYWDKGYNVRDIDLSGISTSGEKYGWNAHYYSDNNNIIYSGDMTSPGPDGAVEYLTVKSDKKNKSLEIVDVTINSFAGEDEYKFDIVVGLTDDDNIESKVMMKPKDLIFCGERKTSSKGNSLGLIVIDGTHKKFVFAPSETSNLRVSRNNAVRQEATNAAMLHKIKYSLTLNKLIQLLGGEIVHEMEQDAIDLSPQNINKDFFNLIID